MTCIEDLRQAARRKVPRAFFEYADGGAYSEQTLRANRADLEAIKLRQRILARLLLLPPHDPQFRRNRERIIRDAERENVLLEWDLGVPEDADGEFPVAAES